MDNKKLLLNEELSRFRMLNEYSFYVPEGDNPKGPIDDLLLSEEDPEEEPEADTDGDMAGLEDELNGELGDEASAEEDDMGLEDAADDAVDFGDESGDNAGSDVTIEPKPEDEAVELDVTELVASTDEAKQAAADANNKVDQLMGMVSKLESQLGDINAIGAKIDSLGHELEKRAPTPEEKIEMRSLDSAPYNIKLTDFWSTKEGKYDVMNTDKKEEYVLTKDDVDSDYSEARIKSSMEETNPYEEEDIF